MRLERIDALETEVVEDGGCRKVVPVFRLSRGDGLGRLSHDVRELGGLEGFAAGAFELAEGVEGAGANEGGFVLSKFDEEFEEAAVAEFTHGPSDGGACGGGGGITQGEQTFDAFLLLAEMPQPDQSGRGDAVVFVEESLAEDIFGVFHFRVPESFDGIGADAGIGVLQLGVKPRRVIGELGDILGSFGADEGVVLTHQLHLKRHEAVGTQGTAENVDRADSAVAAAGLVAWRNGESVLGEANLEARACLEECIGDFSGLIERHTIGIGECGDIEVTFGESSGQEHGLRLIFQGAQEFRHQSDESAGFVPHPGFEPGTCLGGRLLA